MTAPGSPERARPPAPESPRNWRARAVTLLLFLFTANVTYWAWPPFDVSWLAWFLFVPFFAFLDRLSRLRHQLLFVTLWACWGYTVAYFWLAGTLQVFAGLHPIPAFALLAGFGLLGSTSFIPFLILRRWWLLRGGQGLREPGSTPGAVFVIAGLWLAMEGWWPRLFPWYAGLTQHDVALTRQLAELAGITAISLPIILTNLVIYEGGRLLLARRAAGPRPTAPGQVLELGLAVALVVVLLGYAGWRLGEERSLAAGAAPVARIALIQGNVGNEEKLDSEAGGVAAEGVTQRYGRLTTLAAQQEPDLIVWPETAFPWFISLEEHPSAAELRTWSPDERKGLAAWRFQHQWLAGVAKRSGAALMLGGNEAEGRPRAHGGDRNYNAAFVLDAGRPSASHRKTVLIPFGEVVPWPIEVLFPSLVRPIQERMPRRFVLAPGKSLEPLTVRGHRYAVCICYEAVLDGYIRKMVVDGGAEILINLTNDSWFGDSGEPSQHLALASLRAVELRIPFLRATNTGISCYVDPLGDVHDPTPLFVDTIRVYDVPTHPRTGKTPFARWGRWPLDVLSGLCILLVVLRRVRRRRSPGQQRDMGTDPA